MPLATPILKDGGKWTETSMIPQEITVMEKAPPANVTASPLA